MFGSVIHNTVASEARDNVNLGARFIAYHSLCSCARLGASSVNLSLITTRLENKEMLWDGKVSVSMSSCPRELEVGV